MEYLNNNAIFFHHFINTHHKCSLYSQKFTTTYRIFIFLAFVY